ncbi:MAG: F0F1 ATP synthase subunit B, partial [Magnetococcales bacterium]|nr:F0F1 ATP synthase subunit B [Magnetococcales bacterium]
LMIASAHASAGGAAASSGLPQFEPSVFGSQIFWTVVSFFLLMALLKKYVLPAIVNILDSRASRIAEDLQKAESARKEGERLLVNYQGQMVAARQMAAQTLEEARQDAIRHREAALEELNKELAKKKNAALVEIEQAKNKAMEEVRGAAVELSMLVAEKLIVKAINAEDANRMVQEAVKQLGEGGQASLH